MKNQIKTWYRICFAVLFVTASCRNESESMRASFDIFSGAVAGSSGGSAGGSNTGSGEGEGGVINPPGGGPGGDGGSVAGFVTENFTQNSYTERYDFLWVVDNSGSMSDIRAYLSQNLDSFVDILENRRSLDWQMAVTITDNVDYNGNLVSAPGGPRVVSRATPNAAVAWRNLVASIPGTSHSHWEQGLESGRSAIERYGNEFQRSSTPLVIAYVSDEQDYSCQSGCANFSGIAEMTPGALWFPTSRYTDHYNQVRARNSADVIVYSIVHMRPLNQIGSCDDTYGSIGSRYMETQAAAGTGASLSLCRQDLAASIAQVAQLTANLGVCFNLGRRIASTTDMVVRIDGTAIPASATNGYAVEYNPDRVCFNGSVIPQNGSQVQVYYRARP